MSLQIKSTVQTGELAAFWCKKTLPLQVLRSQAGYYIGTRDEDGMPCSRESNEYFRTEEAAQKAFGCGGWTQKVAP